VSAAVSKVFVVAFALFNVVVVVYARRLALILFLVNDVAILKAQKQQMKRKYKERFQVNVARVQVSVPLGRKTDAGRICRFYFSFGECSNFGPECHKAIYQGLVGRL